MHAIDSHFHVITRHAPIYPDAHYAPEYEASAEEWLQLVGRTGITHGVAVQPAFYGTDNRVLLDALQRHGERLRAVVAVPAGVPIERLRRWDKLGVRGIRLSFDGSGSTPDIAAREWRLLFRSAAELGWHLEVDATGADLAAVLEQLHLHGCPIVVAHFGRPHPRHGLRCAGVQAIQRLAARVPLYVKLAAPYRCAPADCKAYARHYLEALGPQRLLWGSDWPWVHFEHQHRFVETRGWFEHWIESAEARRTILWDAPARLYGFVRQLPIPADVRAPSDAPMRARGVAPA